MHAASVMKDWNSMGLGTFGVYLQSHEEVPMRKHPEAGFTEPFLQEYRQRLHRKDSLLLKLSDAPSSPRQRAVTRHSKGAEKQDSNILRFLQRESKLYHHIPEYLLKSRFNQDTLC